MAGLCRLLPVTTIRFRASNLQTEEGVADGSISHKSPILNILLWIKANILVATSIYTKELYLGLSYTPIYYSNRTAATRMDAGVELLTGQRPYRE